MLAVLEMRLEVTLNRMFGRLSDGVRISRFTVAALALLAAGWEARATGLLANVPEAANYTMVYEFPIPASGPGWAANLTTNPYSINASASIVPGSFDRVAYYMELVKASGQTQWVYVSMTAFTTNAARLGIPRNYVLRHNAYDTANPSNATIRSNVGGITEGDGINTVNLEFWPSNYGTGNDYGVPGANASTFDCGDGGASASPGHASMQIHNYGASQTLFGYNQWGNAGVCNLGIGNCPTPVNGGVDWTFDNSNIGTFSVRTLQILVRTIGINNLPATNVTASSGWMNAQVAIGTSCDVWAYWGDADQTTNSGLWANGAFIGTYSNGMFNLTRQVTGLTGGATNWYTFLASNAVSMVWATPSENFVTATAPAVNNGAGASVSVGQAVLQGNLTAGGTSDIYIYWGPVDGGQSTNYEHVVKLTDVRQGAFSTTVSALCGFPYYYICLASNEAGSAWAAASTTFSLPASVGKAGYSLGLRGSVFQPVAFAPSAVDLRGAAYSISPTRVFTGTQAGTVLATTELSGKNIVLSGPANSWNEFGGSPGDNFVAALSGRFFPPVSGTYTFRWSEDDRGWLFMDTGDDGVFDSADAVGTYAWDGIGSRTLTAGQGYNFMFFSQDSAGGDGLAFWYTPPGGVEAYVNPSVQAGQWYYASSSTPLVLITNNPVSTGSLTAGTATLNGDLYGKGWGVDVYVFWGTSDGGKVAANWQTNAFVGRFQDWDGPVSQAIGGLMSNELYYYTFFVTNDLMTAWSPNSETFATDQVTIEAADASASETGPDTGSFRVTRPAANTNGALTVYYTLSGSAVSGSDYAALSGSVVIPAGAVSAEFVVTPLEDTAWQEGSESVVATLVPCNYLTGAGNSAVVSIQDDDASPDTWFLRMPLQFTGYNKAETLTNFPVLVTLDVSTPGFSYSQFRSGANADLRFTDGAMARELPYEIESWDTNGQSRVWVQVPVFTNNVTVWMLWRKAGLTAPAYTSNGATWSEKYVSVAHLSETNGTVGNSAMVGSVTTVTGSPAQAVPGAIGTCLQFDGVDDLVSFGNIGRPYDNFTFSAWIKTALGHEIDPESTTTTTGTSGQKYAFDVEIGGNSSAGSGLSVGTNGLSVYEHANAYMPPLAVASTNIGSGWNFVTVTYLNRQPRIYCNGSLVRTGLASPRTPVYAPYKFGGFTYGYLTGFMDEVRISSVPRSANWIWAEYMNAASNSVFPAVGAVESTGYPEITNLVASGVSASVATLNGYLSATGMAATAVAVYWGTQDGGANAGAWANTNWFAAPAAPGAFSKNLTGLSSGTAYFYRYAATNAYGAVWAPATETLLTAAVTLQATDTLAAEVPLDTGVFTVSRGAASDAPLTVYYTFSGTAVNGVDLSYLSGSVTIPSGAATADIIVAPLFNRNYLVQATDTVTLTLIAGGYMAGSPDAGTVTITNWQPSSASGFDVPRNFNSSSAAPLTGYETLAKTGAGTMLVGGSTGNTFKGDITVDTDGGVFKVGAIPGAASGIGVTLPGMTAANTITVKRGGNFYIEDNVNGSVSSAPNRFGTDGNRPAVKLQGGTLTLNGANYSATVPQNFGPLTLDSGFNTVNATRASGTPELVFSDVTQAKGSHVNFAGSSLGTAALNAPHVRFTSPPVLKGGDGAAGTTTMSIMPGARYGSDWVTHSGTAGIRALAAAEYKTVANNDINTAGANENVRMTAALTAFPPLAADKTVNSLLINVAATAYWSPTNKLTITSGQLISGVPNNQMVISYPSTLTAGSGSDASLDVSVFQNTTYIRSLITDNGSGKITLTKNGGAALTLDGSVDNTYSGGTYVNEGTLNTGGTANRRYLGTGPVRVDAGALVLNHIGATANASGDDYVAVNGGQLQVVTVPYTSDDRFNVGPGCVILGTWSAGMGLNSLDRGFGVAGATPNITLAPDAIIAHNFTLTAPLNLSLNTVKNLGTNADLYYGVISDQNNVAGAITIGSNTAFKGVSTDRSDRRWSVGTINVTPGTDEIWLQGMVRPGTTPAQLYLGNWTIPGGPVIAPAGPLTANVIGTLILDNSTATYGDNSAGKPVTFAIQAGSTLNVNKMNAMGSGTGIASARIKDGGTLVFGTPAGVNGAVTVEAGGKIIANNTGGMTGSGAITLNSGSILELTATTGFTGPQADAIADSLLPGQLIRLAVGGFGTPTDTLDSRVAGKAPIYELLGNNGAANPLVAGTTVMTLNKDASTGLGGMLVNDYAGRILPSAANGVLAIGANGGTIAATSNTTLEVQQRFALEDHALTIGATNVLDRILLPKLGTVYLNAYLGINTALPGSSITVIPGATLMNTANAIPDEPDLTVDGLFLVNGAETIGSLAGSGLVNLQGNALTAGRNNNASTFSGLLTNSLTTALLTKTGTGRMDITSSGHPYTGMFAVNNGILALSGDGAMATPAGTAAYTLSGNGTLLLDNSDVNKPDRLAGVSSGITFQGGTFRFVGKNGEASGESLGVASFFNGASTIDIVNGTGAGSSAEVVFGAAVVGGGSVNFTASNGTLGTAGDHPRVFFTGLGEGLLGFATVGGVPAYYSLETGVRAFTLAEGLEFNGTLDQTGLDTLYTTNNLHQPLNASRTVNSLWIDSPGIGNVVNLGSSDANSLSLASGRLSLTGANDFALTRSGTSSGTLTRQANGTLFLGVDSGRTLTVGVPIANGLGTVEKDGAGTLVLSAVSTFTGPLTVNAGTVRYAAGGDLSAPAVNIWNAGVLDFAGYSDTLGSLTIYSGGVTNSSANGALTVPALVMGGGPAGSSTYVQTGTGSLKLTGNVTYSALNDPDMATIRGKLDLNGATRTFSVNNSVAAGATVDMDISATIIGAAGFGITKNGVGVLRLSASNAFDGPVSAPDGSGTIILNHPRSLGTPSAGRTLSIGNVDTLALDASNGTIVFPALYTNLFLNGAGDSLIGPIRGALANRSGNHTIACPVTLTGNGVYLASLQAGGKLTLSGNISGTQDLTVNGDGDTELGGAIATGAKSLVKNGTGTLTLSGTGTNTFSGATTVNAGKLLLAKASGTAPVNAIANGGVLTINSGAVLQYAASSANPDMIGTNAITLNGTGLLDFNGSSDSLGTVTINSYGATADSTAITNTAAGGNLAVNGLNITPVQGCLTRIDTGTGTLTLSNNLIFTAASTGRAQLSGKLSLGAATRNFTINQGIHSNVDMVIDAVISGAAGVGIIKDTTQYSWGLGTGGILRFEGANTFDGNVTLADSNKGTLVLANNQALGTPSTARIVSIGSGGTLALDGGVSIADPNNRLEVVLNGTGDTRLFPVNGALVSMTGTNTVPCKITLTNNTQFASANRLVLQGMVNGGARTLTLAGPGETALAGLNGMITNVSSITVISNGTLVLANTVLSNRPDRIINTIPVTLAGGGLRFSHDGGAANFSETLGALTVSAGTNTVFASRAAGGQTSALTFASLTCVGGTVNFVGEGLGENAQNRIFITGLADGMIGPWAFINGTNLALYSSAKGVYAGAGGEQGVAARGNVPNAVITNNPAISAVINEPGDAGPITLEALWTNQVLEVRQETTYASVVAMTNNTATKALQTSRLMIGVGKAALTIGQAENSGALMALTSGGTLSLENQSAAEKLTVNAAVANNNAASGLSKFGVGTVLLTGSNSYSGATLINNGTLEFGGSSTQLLAGVISGNGALAKSGSGKLALGAGNTYMGLTTVKQGTIVANSDATFGSTAIGTVVEPGATLDVGSVKAVHTLYLAETFTVSGKGVEDKGAIVNNSGIEQGNAFGKITLAGDTTFGGLARWDLRANTPTLIMNGYDITKVGTNNVWLYNTVVFPNGEDRTGDIDVNVGGLLLDGWNNLNGGAANTLTVRSGTKLQMNSFQNLYPVGWTLALVTNSTVAISAGSGSGYNVWSGPVTLTGSAILSPSSGCSATFTNALSGNGAVIVNNAGTIYLSALTNTYTGTTIVSNGTLYAQYTGSLPGQDVAGKVSVLSNGTLAVYYSADAQKGWDKDHIEAVITNASFGTVLSYLGIDTAGGDLLYDRDLTQTLGLVKYGTNTLTLTGKNTYGGRTLVTGGTLRFAATSSNRLDRLFVGNSSAPAAVIQEGGYVISGTGPAVNGSETLAVGSGATGSYGYYRMNGGSLATGWLSVPGNNGLNAAFDLYDGDVTVTGSSSWLIMGWININNSASAINLFGGRMRNPPSGNEVSMNHNGSRNSFCMINLLGSNAVFDTTVNSRNLRLSTAGTNLLSVVNLNSGTLVANRVYAGNTTTPSLLNFNGGTLKANTSQTTFLQGLTAATVYPGGAVIDTTNVNVTVLQPLLAPKGYGITGIPLRSGGAGYIGAPVVVITGGSGTGATAIASVDLTDGSPTKGSVTGITIVTPGSGYQSGDKPIVSLAGGGYTVMALTDDCVLGLNDASGGLTKLGTGTLTLSGANTYTGATTIAAGTLKLGTAAALMPNTPIVLAGGTLDLSGYTVTNLISGTGQVINGTVESVFSPAGTGVLGTNTVALSFTGATLRGKYLVDVTLAGESDLLNVQGNIDLTNLDLQVVDTAKLNTDKVYTIMTCSGVRTGKFNPVNLPDARWHVIYRPDGSVQLRFVGGTLMWLR